MQSANGRINTVSLSMASQPTGPPVSYRTVPNRNVTKRWKEANTVDYGSGWGDDEYDQPSGPPPDQRNQEWDSQGQQPTPPGGFYPPNRGADHSPMRTGGRPSFDQGPGRPSFDQRHVRPSFDRGSSRQSFDQNDDRRGFAGNSGSFDGPYPTAARVPFRDPHQEFMPDDFEGPRRSLRGPPPIDDFEAPPRRSLRGPPPLSIHTNARPSSRDRGPYSATGQFPGGQRRSDQYSEPFGPYSAGPAPGGRRSHSSNRPPPGEIFARHESPARPGSRGSQGGSPSRFQQPPPPRKSSMSQQNPPPEFSNEPISQSDPPMMQSESQPSEVKPLPFVRPIDIWNRHKDELSEKQSQASSRPSMDSSISRDQATANLNREVPATDAIQTEPVVHQPSLDPVTERRSEHGMDNMTHPTDNSAQSAYVQVTSPTPQPSEGGSAGDPPSATSDYSNYVDKTSLYSSPSFREQRPDRSGLDEVPSREPAENPLPKINTVSSFGDEFLEPRSASRSQQEQASRPAEMANEFPFQPERQAPPPPPAKDNLPMIVGGSDVERSNSRGYRSLVQHAFDDSQREPPTPVSAADTVTRTNSASTSEISPIVSRPPVMHSIQETMTTPPTEPEYFNHNSDYAANVAGENQSNRPEPMMPHQAMYDSNGFPHRADSPARSPPVIQNANVAPPEAGILSSVPQGPSIDDSERSFKPLPMARISTGPEQMPASQSKVEQAGLSAGSAEQDSRSASDEYREWQAERRQFNAKMGIQDSPSIEEPSPVSREESLSKGNVRDLAGRYEQRSGRSSPMNSEAARPANARLESFRPVLPGGWQSYTTNTPTPRSESPSQNVQPLSRPEPVRTETTESQIPRAGPPRRQQDDHPSKAAFAAAAAAGSALAGAFAGGKASRFRPSSDISTEVSEDSTATSNSRQPSEESRQYSEEASPETPRATAPAHVPPPPLPKDTPRDEPQDSNASDYFPAPLRTSRSSEARREPWLAPGDNIDDRPSPGIRDNDRLQEEIVQHLTPRSSVNDQENLVDDISGRSNENGPENLDQSRPMYGNSAPASNEVESTHQDQAPRPGLLDQRFSWEQEQPSASSATTPPLPTMISAMGLSERPSTNPEPESVPSSLAAVRGSDHPTLDGEDRQIERDESALPSSIVPTPTTSMIFPPQAPPKDQSPTDTVRNATQEPISSNLGLRSPGRENASIGTPTIVAATQEIPLRQIMGMESPDARRRAYDTNRQHFAQNDSGLSQWLQGMGQASPDSAAIIASNGQMSPQQNEKLSNYRPSPSRTVLSRLTSDNFRSDSSPSGSKQGRLMGKAGTAAKGFLAKSKDKLRTASAGDKVAY